MNSKKRKMVSFLAILLVIIMIIGTIAPFAQVIFASPVTTTSTGVGNEETGGKTSVSSVIENNSFDITADIGFDGEYIVGSEVPVRVTIKNNGEDFKGRLDLKVYLSYDDSVYGYGEPRKYVIYYVDVDLPKGTIKDYSIDSTINTLNTSLELSLKDNKGKTVYRNNFPVKGLSPDTIATAIITDNPREMDYIKGLDLYMDKDESYKTNEKIIVYDESNFPNKKTILDSFENIIITNFDSSWLDENQVNAILSWVENGGNLFLGTGENENRSISAFEDTFKVSASNPSGKNFLVNTGLSGMQTCDIVGEGFNTIVEDSGVPLFVSKKVGNGNVVIATFDMALSPFSTYSGNNNIIKSAFENGGINILRSDESSLLERMWNYESSEVMTMGETGINIIFIFIILYIIFVGPVLYIILKKKDKREYGWFIIPIASIIMTVAVFGVSKIYGYNKGIMGVVSTVDLNSDDGFGNAYISVSAKSPNAGKVSLKLSEKLPLNLFLYDSYRVSDDDFIAEVNVGDESAISFNNTEKWDDNNILVTKKVDMGGNFDFDASIQGNILKLNMNNKTSHNFENLILNIRNMSFHLGDIASGESIEKDLDLSDNTLYINKGLLNGVDVYLGSDNGYYDLENMYKSNEYTKKQVFNDYVRGSVFGSNMDSEYLRYSEMGEEAKNGITMSLYMFDSDSILNDGSLINGKAPISLINNVYYIDKVISYVYMDSYDIPDGMILPTVLDNESQGVFDYNVDDNYLYVYSDKDISLENNTSVGAEVSMIFDMPIKSNIKSFKISGYNMPSVKEEIYNVKTGAYETLISSDITDISSYINENGEVKIKISYPLEHKEYIFPTISVKGGNADA